MVRLCLFDCDGTLVDSQHAIVAAMTEAFANERLPPPTGDQVRAVVGLALKAAIAALLPDGDGPTVERLAAGYAAAFARQRRAGGAPEPLYPGVLETLDLIERQGWLLGLATGKSRRGALTTLAGHGLTDRFVTVQTADAVPGKPAPDMILQAMSETGAIRSRTVMIGDTAFDMAMARNAGTRALGVSWGYHAERQLWTAGADAVVHAFADIAEILDRWRRADAVG